MKNVPDTMLQIARGAWNELPAPGPDRWGKRALLHLSAITGPPLIAPRDRLTFISTGPQPQITPMAVSLRFSTDNATFTPAVPSAFTGTVHVDLIQMIDVKTGAFVESFDLEADETQPFCSVMCMALQVNVRIEADDASQQLYVQAVACPTMTMDCADINGGGGTGGNVTATIKPFPETFVTRHPASNIANLTIANPDRAYALLANMSTVANMFVLLGEGVSFTPGDEIATIIMPPNTFAGYEVLNYTGPIDIVWDQDDSTNGYGLVTEGVYT